MWDDIVYFRNKEAEKVMAGPKYWPWGVQGEYGAPKGLLEENGVLRSSLDTKSVTYKDYLIELYYKGYHTMYRDERIISYDLKYQLLNKNVVEGLKDKTYWHKYLEPGWCTPAARDGNAVLPEMKVSIPYDLLKTEHSSDHSYFNVPQGLYEEELTIKSLLEEVHSKELKPFVYDGNRYDYVKLDQIDLGQNYYNVGNNQSIDYTFHYDMTGELDPLNINHWFARGVLTDKFAVSIITREEELASILTFTDLKEPGDLTETNRNNLDNYYYFYEDGYIPVAYDFYEIIDVLFAVMGTYCVLHLGWIYYYHYFRFLYTLGWKDDWDSIYTLRLFLEIDTRDSAAKQVDAEYLEGIVVKTKLDWESFVNMYVWVSQHSLDWSYGLVGDILHYIECLEIFSENWIL